MKYRIHPKQDFGDGPGFWLPNAPPYVGTERYGWVKRGFVVSDGFCNIMPAATWFRTIGEAMDALKILIDVGGEGNASEFWRRLYARREITR